MVGPLPGSFCKNSYLLQQLHFLFKVLFPNEGSTTTMDGDICIPAGFGTQVRRLPPSTQVHIPSATREQIAVLTTTCWEGFAAKLQGWGGLEEGCSKLLLACIPDGAHVPTEVAKRITLFAKRLFEELLARVELQDATNGIKSQRRRRQQESTANKNARKAVAKKQAAEGAY